jgi:hypothetical protein
MRKKTTLALTLAAALLPLGAFAQVKPFGVLDCVSEQGVRFCAGSVSTRIKSFDGVPLDVNVTLPATGDRALPLVIQLHGWGDSKGGIDVSQEWAAAGYAVLNYTARGFGDSCGSATSRTADTQGCASGWIHLADSRFEIHDSQYLAGLLVDQGLVHPKKIAVTGPSYGGGQSLQLATLRDRVRLTDGTLVKWRSPAGRSMRLAAAAPIIPWSDLVYSLTPNGRTLDYLATSSTADLSPFGVMKESFVTGLFVLGQATGFYAPPGVDSGADLQTWYAVINAGEPYDPTVVGPIANEIANNHSAFYLPARKPAPILIANGFTDDLFPVLEALRYVNRFPRETIAQFHFDMGHMRGQNKAADEALLNARVHDWFDRYVKRDHHAVPLKGIEVLTQTCPSTAASGGPFFARNWAALHPGEVRFSDATAKTILSVGDTLGSQVDPVLGGGACVRTSATDQTAAATYRLPAATGTGYTLLGTPTVIADLTVTGVSPQNSELAGRLWDVASDGMQTMVARALYRPSANGQIVFELNANGWHFDAGHIAKLELLGSDVPYGRLCNAPFTLGVSNLELRLPTLEPADGAQILTPAPPVTPGS